MDYGKLVSDAARLVWRFKALWIFGVIAALCSGSGGNNFNYSFSDFDVQSGRVPPQMAQLFELFTRPGVIAGLILLGLVLVVVAALVRAVAEGAMIGMANEADEDGQPTFNSGLAAGTRHALTIFVTDIVLALPIVALVILAIVLFVLPLVGAGVAGAGQDGQAEGAIAAALAGSFALLCVMACVGILLAITLSFVRNAALRAIVLEEQGVFGAIGRGWRVFRSRMVDFILVAVLLWIIGFILGIVIGIPLVAFGASGLIPALVELGRSGELRPVLLIPVLFTALIAGIFAALFEGALLAFGSTLWTLTYRAATGRRPLAEPVVATPPSQTPGYS